MSTSSASAGYDFIVGLKAACEAALATWPADQVVVVVGQPSTFQLDNYQDVVSVGEAENTQDAATLSTNRSREEILRGTVVIQSWRPGGQEQEQVALDAAYDILRAIEYQVRRTDATLGGVVRHCFPTGHRTESVATMEGRAREIAATFEARVRITG